MNFCEECNKIVPDTEVKQPFKNLKEGFKNDKRIHVYHKTVNISNRSGNSDVIGCCLVNEIVWCGDIREPTDQEYFIYHTIQNK